MLIRQRECHSYYRDVHYYVIICHAPTAAFLLATTPLDATKKINMFSFRRSQIEAESQSNSNCNSRFSATVVTDDT